MSDLIRVGFVRKTHGVQGHVCVGLLTDFPEERFGEGMCLRAISSTGSVEKELVIEKSRPYREDYLVKFEGYDNPEDSRELKGFELCIEKEHRMPLDEDDFYVDQLVGMSVQSPSGFLGRVCRVEVYPGHPVLEICSENGCYSMVPFVKAFVENVDLSADMITLSREAVDAD